MKRKPKEEPEVIHDTRILEDYKNWRIKELSCNVSNRFYDQVKYVANRNKKTVNEFVEEAIKYYMENKYPKKYDVSKMYVRAIEQDKIRRDEYNV